MTGKYETFSPQETEELGMKLALSLKPGDVVALDGDLGAGKTVFTRGICRGMGLDPDNVMSPTFTIVNEYDEPADKVPVFHFDTYRLSGTDDFLASGLDEYFARDGVCVIEWSSVIEDLLPDNTVRVVIKGTGDAREITIDPSEGIR